MSDEHGEFESGASRRAWLAGAGAIGATAVLAACGGESPEGPSGGPGGQGNDGQGNGGEPGSGDNGGGPEPLTSADEVEVGGGVILAEETVVITQPTAGNFVGLSAACTHEGCTVSSIQDGIIHCACHGSQYSIEDGSVVRAAPGLTTETQNPLPAVEIRQEGGTIVRA